jgi:hypothetical protein
MTISIVSVSLILHEVTTMAKHIRPSEPTLPRIKATSPRVRRIDPQTVAKELGGEELTDHVQVRPGPLTLYALRSELWQRRQSSGGRPGIEGTSLRAKIPLNEQDWKRLEALATSLSSEGCSPSAGQVASVLLSMALRSVAEEPDAPPAVHAAAVARELAARATADKSR